MKGASKGGRRRPDRDSSDEPSSSPLKSEVDSEVREDQDTPDIREDQQHVTRDVRENDEQETPDEIEKFIAEMEKDQEM